MPMTAEQFNQADPKVRAFYASFRDRYLSLIMPYYPLSWLNLVPQTPCQVAQRSRIYQIVNGIAEDINRPELIDNVNNVLPTYSPVYEYWLGSGYPDQWYWIPIFWPDLLADYDPDTWVPPDDWQPGDKPDCRQRYKIPRTYRNGFSHKRRNL